MALRKETKRIGEHDYTVTQLDAVQGRRALVRLVKVLGPSLSAAKGAAEDRGAGFLTSIAERLTEADLDHFCDLFARYTSVSGGSYGTKAPQLSDIFPFHFPDRYREMFEWLAFALKVNFGPLWRGVATASDESPAGSATH